MDRPDIASATILSIVAAHPGWSEISRPSSGEEVELTRPVAVWALIEDVAGDRFVVGLAPGDTPGEWALQPANWLFERYEFEGGS